ncbi:MAG: antibiotic biosynthesis monooxygenase family protein [Pseudomonadota bacterium]
MYARFSEVQVKPGKVNDFVQIFKDQMIPPAREQPGFKGVTVLADETVSLVLLTSYWETEADAKAVEPSSGSIQTQMSKIAELIEQKPDVRIVKVAHQE